MRVQGISALLGTACAVFSFAQSAEAQEWSAAQQEVWSFILSCNEHYVAKDETAILACFHEDFSGWQYGDTVPRSKASIAKFLPVDLEGETLAYDLRPISIRVFGDFAVVHYSLTQALRMPDGEVVRERMIWTDIMLKQGNRWRWVADHGGTIE